MIFRFKDSMDFFTTIDEALEVAEQSGVPKSDIICLTTDEYEQLFEGQEIPDERSAKTPIEYLRSQEDKGATPITKRHPSNELPAHKEKLNTKNYLREWVIRGLLDLKQDPFLPSCPYCSESWSKIESNLAPEHREELAIYAGNPLKFKDSLPQEIQTGGSRNQNKQYADAKIPLKVHHLKTKHQAIFQLLVDAGVVMQFEPVTDDYGNTNLRPTNKKNVESLTELSNEKLSALINSDPKKRKAFFRAWVKQLQQR